MLNSLSPAPSVAPETFEFPAQPDIMPVLDLGCSHEYMLRSDFIVPKKYSGLSFDVFIPRGFETDGASAPQFTWSIFGIIPDGLWRGAAVAHDYLYSCGGDFYISEHDKWYSFSRKDCDRALRNLMLISGVGKFKAWETYWAVRLFGGSHFRR